MMPKVLHHYREIRQKNSVHAITIVIYKINNALQHRHITPSIRPVFWRSSEIDNHLELVFRQEAFHDLQEFLPSLQLAIANLNSCMLKKRM